MTLGPAGGWGPGCLSGAGDSPDASVVAVGAVLLLLLSLVSRCSLVLFVRLCLGLLGDQENMLRGSSISVITFEPSVTSAMNKAISAPCSTSNCFLVITQRSLRITRNTPSKPPSSHRMKCPGSRTVLDRSFVYPKMWANCLLLTIHKGCKLR